MNTPALIDPSDIEPAIAGTLIPLSCYPNQPCACIAQKIIANFDLLARCPHLSPTFRALCERLQLHWENTAKTRGTQLAELQRETSSLH
jgi:hypothetical protein